MKGSNQDRVLWTLSEHDNSMTKSDLARRLQLRQAELDVVLQEMEQLEKSDYQKQRENWL